MKEDQLKKLNELFKKRSKLEFMENHLYDSLNDLDNGLEVSTTIDGVNINVDISKHDYRDILNIIKEKIHKEYIDTCEECDSYIISKKVD